MIVYEKKIALHKALGKGTERGEEKDLLALFHKCIPGCNTNENCTLNAGLICDEIRSKEYISGMIT